MDSLTARTNNNDGRNYKSRFSLAFRITVISMLLSFLCVSIVSVVSIVNSRNSAITYWGDRASAVAYTVSWAIQGHVFADSLDRELDESWQFVQNLLDSVAAGIDGLTFLYVMLPYDAYRFVYFASAGMPELFGYVDVPETYGDEPWDSLRQGLITSTRMTVSPWGRFVAGFAPVVDNLGNRVAVVGADIEAEVINQSVLRYFLRNLVIGLIAAILVGLTTKYLLTAALLKSFRRITSIDFTSHKDIKEYKPRAVDKNSNDLTSAMYTHFSSVVKTVDNIQSDISDLLANHLAGYYEFRLDPSKYAGDHKHLAEDINAFADMYVNNFIELTKVVGEYGKGNFDANVSRYPNNWKWANDAIDELRNGFILLVSEISRLANNATQGSFDLQADEANHKGAWLGIIKGLNQLISAIYNPLNEINENVKIMAKGDFTLLEGNYSGKFAILKDSCNMVNKRTAAYVEEIAKTLKAMAMGDLTTMIKEDYVGSYGPIKQSINTMLESLNSVMADVIKISEFVAVSAKQTSDSSQKIAEGNLKQTAYIEELSNSINIFQEKAARTNQDANTASIDANKARETVSHSNVYVKLMEENMNKIKTSSESIGKIIGVITSIAFQTNLLAINASIEAARAGEVGKGFSVVADEVRSLAGRSQSSAKETEEIISEDAHSVKQGLEMTDNVVEAFKIITEHITKISGLIKDISDESGGQLEYISAINTNVSEILEIVRETSDSANESNDAAKELSTQSELLREKVSFFKLKKNS